MKERESLAHYEGEDEDNISYIRYEYDLRGRAIKTISDFPATAKDAYTLTSYISPLYTEVQDPQGHRKGVLKDVFGNNIRITEFTREGVYHTYYDYDLEGNLTKVCDAKGNITQLWYDSLGRKLKMDDPDMGLWYYEYDKLGNLTRQTDAKEQTIQFEYDSLNRLLRKYTATGTLATYYYNDDLTRLTSGEIETLKSQNKIGRLDEVRYLTGQSEFFYDSEGRETKSVKTVGSSQYVVCREYDILDRLKSLTYPDGEVINYTYDTNSGLLERVYSTNSQLQTPNYVQDITYNASGQIKTIQYGNETETSYSYGRDLRLERILTQNSTISLQDLNYDFDKNGNLITLADSLTSNIRTYQYDDLDRLSSAQNIPTAEGHTTLYYHYDPIGNMTYKSDVGVMEYGQNGAGPHAVTSLQRHETISYSYDANGNMTQGKDKTMEYDIENRLTKVSASGATTEFYYDGDGGRLKKTVDSGHSTVYIGSLYEIRNTDDGIRNVKHIFAGSNRICSIRNTDDGIRNTDYYHSDHLGSSNVITDGNGDKVANYEYQPYGSISSTNSELRTTNYLFTGKELDSSTGLYYYGARYYDPEIGRFITADSIVQAPYDPQTLNRYSYCRNNPVKYVDPTGHFFWGIILGAILGAGIGAVVSAATGGNVGKGAIAGAIAGAFFGFVGGFEISGVAKALAHTWAGAASGALGAIATGGDVGMSALIGGAAAGVTSCISSYVPFLQTEKGAYLTNVLKRSAIGAVIGGGISSATGGDFAYGAKQGAISAGIAYTANETLHRGINKVKNALNANRSSNTIKKESVVDLKVSEYEVWRKASTIRNFGNRIVDNVLAPVPLFPQTWDYDVMVFEERAKYKISYEINKDTGTVSLLTNPTEIYGTRYSVKINEYRTTKREWLNDDFPPKK